MFYVWYPNDRYPVACYNTVEQAQGHADRIGAKVVS